MYPYLSLLELLLVALSPYLLVCCRFYCLGDAPSAVKLHYMHIDIYMQTCVFSKVCVFVCASSLGAFASLDYVDMFSLMMIA